MFKGDPDTCHATKAEKLKDNKIIKEKHTNNDLYYAKNLTYVIFKYREKRDGKIL